MGMAASQARYLALTARKTNTEYEGQQINQARTALANQSANLFNRLLDLEVPVAPKTTDYTELQYSFTDGQNESVIEEWTQLSSPNPDANYLVKHYYYTNKFTGAMRQLNDPQVQIAGGTISTTNEGLRNAVKNLNVLDEAIENRNNILQASQTMTNYSTPKENIYSIQETTNGYELLDATGNVIDRFINYAVVAPNSQEQADSIFTKLEEMQALKEEIKNNKQNDVFINSNGEIALRSELEALLDTTTEGSKILQTYNLENVISEAEKYTFKNTIAETELQTALMNNPSHIEYFESLKMPTHIGNCELVAFDPTDKNQMTQIKQIMSDMKEQNINDGISKCFDENGNYVAGIYSFQMNGQQYFTTYEELLASYDSHTGPNDIDGQIKLPYYNTSYIKTRVEQTSEALLETDSEGRFKSVKFADNSLIYSLNTETVTDEAAYEDAMNEYRYKVQQYEKTIADINARTSIIQEEDRTLELRLKQLDTEQKALSTEMDAVKKVISDNVEKTFKTFSD